MTGDFSRNTYKPSKNFSLVRMQQGRLFTDADWNEQGDILRAADRETAADIIGHTGVPQDDAGFAIRADGPTDTLIIGAGTAYVNGVRHVLGPPDKFVIEKDSGNGANTVWKIKSGAVLEDGDTLATGTGNGASVHTVSQFATAQDGTRTFRTAPAMPAATTEVFRLTTMGYQPWAPRIDPPKNNDTYIAFLKSFELPVTALDDETIRESAFAGPDTAIRDRTIWQVGLVSRGMLLDRGLNDEDLTCPALAGGGDPVLGDRKPGLLRAWTKESDIKKTPCRLPPSAGYRSLENRLYRVEIHNAGSGATRFKWSRENAIHRTRYDEIDAGVLVVKSTGRDEQTKLKKDEWIEIRDQDAILAEQPGYFARISEVVGDRVSLAEILDPETLDPQLAGNQPNTDVLPRAAFVTRWEGGKPQNVNPAQPNGVELENGVRVGFGGVRFQVGDYWTIPARSLAGDVEWPVDVISGEPLNQPPEGPRRDYGALARVVRSNAGWSVEDCRPQFPAAVNSLQVLYCSGDGQEALPDPLNPANRVDLPEALCVAVVRGHEPVADVTIRFEVTLGDGRLGNGQKVQDVTTNAEGLAEVDWRLDAAMFSQQVTARRLHEPATPDFSHTPIIFNGTLSRADKTSFNPNGIASLAGANTVQKAIEALAAMQQIGCATHIITQDQQWEGVLEGIKQESNVVICFAPGTYKLTRTVQMTKLGHVTLHGAGPGTAEIIVDRAESALAFFDCDSVTVRGLSVATPAGNSGIDPALKGNRQGSLDFTLCTEVVVEDCMVSCGAGTSPERTCITVRGSLEQKKPPKPSRYVRIHGNRFTVGHMQEAILVTDARDIDISNNRIVVRPRKVVSRPGGGFIKDKKWLAKAVKGLVAKPVKGTSKSRGNKKRIRAREWVVDFHSPVPQATWDEMVKADPPKDRELESKDGFESYSVRLLKTAASNPDRFPSLKTQIDGLAKGLGTDGDTLKRKPEVITNLLVTSQPKAYRFDAKRGGGGEGGGKGREVLLEANGSVLSFDSPFSQDDWNKALARTKEAAKVANAGELLALSQGIAKRLILDERFRRGLGSVTNWLDRFRNNSTSLALQGIVCGGRVLDNVRIHANVIRDCQVGIRVATSHLREGKFTAKSVQIEDNRMELLTQAPDFYAGYGMFVGNVETLRILGNDMALSPRPNFRQFFAQGIRIWGFIGRQVLVSQNRIAMATMGIRLHEVTKDKGTKGYLWVFSQNLIEGPKGTRVYKVVPPIQIDEINEVAPIF